MYNQSFNTRPAPSANAMAMANASVNLATPDSMSPVRKSRKALVMAAPGTNSMRVPIIMKSALSARCR